MAPILIPDHSMKARSLCLQPDVFRPLRVHQNQIDDKMRIWIAWILHSVNSEMEGSSSSTAGTTDTRPAANTERVDVSPSDIRYVNYEGENQLPLIMNIIDQELSEPYSIFTYRYFITLWPQLCFLAFHEDTCVGTVVCKMGQHRNTFRGYIAMLVVIKPYRGKGIATQLVTRSIQVMRDSGCEEVTLEAEVTNKGALALYEHLGFIRSKRLFRYYLNGVDAFRLKLLFPCHDANALLMLNEDNYNVDLAIDFPHEQHHHWDEHMKCSEHCHESK